ncbi:putative Reverse transcriptase (RNA dependent DNA polymerase) [Trypanosoma vivax]|nr:putative Reverse transcriptase (RNA dependent DNA polymerase) [Trypanosoma vivax]
MVINALSENMPLTCGVPQGSVLGPLLFIVTVDSLSRRLNRVPEMQHGFFADDLTIVCTSAYLSEIQQDQPPTLGLRHELVGGVFHVGIGGEY